MKKEDVEQEYMTEEEEVNEKYKDVIEIRDLRKDEIEEIIKDIDLGIYSEEL